MFGRKKERAVRPWDKERTIPAVRCSICTGEQVFGFKDIHGDGFTEIALIRNDAELRDVAAEYGIPDIKSIQRFY